MRELKIALIAILALLAVVFVVQNTEVVSVRLFLWEVGMSRIILLSGTMLIGFVAGYLVAKLPHAKKSST